MPYPAHRSTVSVKSCAASRASGARRDYGVMTCSSICSPGVRSPQHTVGTCTLARPLTGQSRARTRHAPRARAHARLAHARHAHARTTAARDHARAAARARHAPRHRRATRLGAPCAARLPPMMLPLLAGGSMPKICSPGPISFSRLRTMSSSLRRFCSILSRLFLETS